VVDLGRRARTKTADQVLAKADHHKKTPDAPTSACLDPFVVLLGEHRAGHRSRR
jgi:hypothetical protein